jgi:magnesium transporter
MYDIQTRLDESLRSRDFAGLREAVDNLPPSDLANLISELSSEQQVPVFRVLPRKTAAATFEYLPREKQEELLRSLGQEDVAAILNEMSPDDRTMLLEELPAAAIRQLLSLLDERERSVALNLLGYPEGSVGRLMTPYYIAVYPDWTVQHVLNYIRKHGQDSETLNLIYVVDGRGILIDDIRMRKFLLSDPERRVTELMDYTFTALKATDDRETAVNVFRKADLGALPVTDSDGVLIGIVTSDDILDVAEERATEDIQMFGGSEALDEPYMKIAFSRMVRKRA